MYELKNLKFQPVTINAAKNNSWHLAPRARVKIEKDMISEEMLVAVKEGIISLIEIPQEPSPDNVNYESIEDLKEDPKTAKRRR